MSKMIAKLVIGILVVMLVAGRGIGQEIWSLQECIDYAVAHNLDLRKSTLQNEINKERLQQTKRNILPSATFGGGSSFNFGKSIDPGTNDYVNNTFFTSSYSLGSSVVLFDGFANLNQVSYNKFNYLAGIEDDKRAKNDIAFQVMEAYFNVLFYEGLLEIAREQKQVSELAMNQARSQADAGLKAKSDLLEMASRLAEEEVLVVQTLNYKNAHELKLRQLMNYKQADGFNIENTNKDSFPVGALAIQQDSVMGIAKQNNPFIKGGLLRKQAAEKYLSIMKGNLYPYLGLNANYSTNYSALVGGDDISPMGEQFKNNASQYIGFTLNVPIFNRWGNRSNVKLARLNLEQAQADFELNTQQIEQEVEDNFQQLFALAAEYGQMGKQMEAASLAFEAATKKMGQGLVDAISYYNSKNLLAQAQSNVLRVKLQYELKSRTMDFFMGIPIYSDKLKNQ